MAGAVLLLLVEDEPLVSLSAEDVLTSGGFGVVPAKNGTDAMRILDSQIEELCGVVTDVRLGTGPDSWEVARRARELKADIPIVYTTGDSAHEWTVHGVPQSLIVQKPYADAQLLTAISTLLTRGATP
jgi:CheY-like chemotaxis protein